MIINSFNIKFKNELLIFIKLINLTILIFIIDNIYIYIYRGVGTGGGGGYRTPPFKNMGGAKYVLPPP